MKKISVLLADDHTVVRQGLRTLLMTEPDIDVVAEAENGRQAVQLAIQLKPDVIVMDIAMPQLNGLEAAKQITEENLPVKLLILSSYADSEYVHQLTAAGAAGYVIKQTAASDLINAVREVSKGNAFFSPPVLKQLLEYYRESCKRGGMLQPQSGGQLTSREQEVLQLVAEGHVNKQIASTLFLSIKTVEKHRQQLMNKLGIHDIAGLTRYAIAHGVVESRRRLVGDEEPDRIDSKIVTTADTTATAASAAVPTKPAAPTAPIAPATVAEPKSAASRRRAKLAS
jgi:DNA-binding NarL/FixJ family response regulator